MKHKKYLAAKLGGTLLALSFLSLAAPVSADESVLDIVSYCANPVGQLCDMPFNFDVTTTETLKIKYTVAETHCSSIRLHVSVDGSEMFTTDYLGWNGDEDAKPLETGVIDLSPVSDGLHTVSLQAEGTEGGCNAGDLASWGGTVRIIADMPPITALPNVGGTLTKMSATKGTVTCQNMKTKQKVIFPLSAGDRAWDCEAQGLVVNSGNTIKQTLSVTGKADK